MNENNSPCLVPQVSHAESIIIKFDTDSHSVDAALIGSALINFKRTIEQIAKTRGEVEKTTFEVQRISPGCLEIGAVVQFLQSIANPETLSYLGTNIRDLFALFRFLRGKRPKEVKPDDETHKTITNDSGEKMTFNNCTFNTFVNSPVSPLGDISSLDAKSIRSISIRMEKEGEVARVSGDEFPFFGKRASADATENEKVEESEQILTIAKIPISNPARSTWGFIDNGDSITAKILDEAFVSKIDNRSISFQKGDRVRALVRKRLVFSEQKHCFVTKCREILSILEFNPASTTNQPELF